MTAATARQMSLGFSLQEPREVLFWQLLMLQFH